MYISDVSPAVEEVFENIYHEGQVHKPPNTNRWYSNDFHRLGMVHNIIDSRVEGSMIICYIIDIE